jgi:hypothetical protein
VTRGTWDFSHRRLPCRTATGSIQTTCNYRPASRIAEPACRVAVGEIPTCTLTLCATHRLLLAAAEAATPGNCIQNLLTCHNTKRLVVVHDTTILTVSRADLTDPTLPPCVYNYDMTFMSASCRIFAVLLYNVHALMPGIEQQIDACFSGQSAGQAACAYRCELS